MPQSLSQVVLHVVFSTRNRQAWLTPEIRPRVHAFLAGIGRHTGAEVYRVGGIEDHVHLAVRLPRTLTQADLLEEIKKRSSRWIKDVDPTCEGFAWQRGYGAFSVSRTDLAGLIHYIDHQEEHHRTASFQEEYRGLLDAAGLEYDDLLPGSTPGLVCPRAFGAFRHHRPRTVPESPAAHLRTRVGQREGISKKLETFNPPPS